MATTTTVTQEQLDRCHRIEDLNNRSVFYQVDNEAGAVDDDGNTIEYTVRFTPGKGFSCTCKAGQSGFHYCRSTCKHCRWAAAHAESLRQERREQSALESLVRQGVSREVAQCITYANAHPFQFSVLEIKRAEQANQARPFSILR
jgi:hypothetical protein